MKKSSPARLPLLAAGLLALVLLGNTLAAQAQTTVPIAAPAASSPADGMACPVAVLRVIPLDAESSAAQSVAVTFQTFAESAGKLSGTVTIFGKDKRYDVPFTNAVAVPSLAGGIADQVPIVVHFASPVAVDGAYLSTIAGADGGACGFGNIVRPQGARLADVSAADALVQERAKTVMPIDAPAGTPDPIECKAPYQDASAGTLAMPDEPLVAKLRGDTGRVVIDVALGADGRVLDSWVWESSGKQLLDDAALKAPAQGRFTPERFRCKVVFGVYPLATEFKSSPNQ